MDTRKITLIATIAVIALIAVGVGYAYTATTQNSGNNAQGEYVTLTQTGDGAYKFTKDAEDSIANIKYDTINTGPGQTSYRLASKTIEQVINTKTYTLAQVGNPFVIEATATNAEYTDMTCTFTTTGFNMGNGWCFAIKTVNGTSDPVWTVNTGDGSGWSTKTFTIANDSGTSYKDTTVTVYFGNLKSALPTQPNLNPLQNASIVFTATHAGQYTGDLYNINLFKIGGNGAVTIDKVSAAAAETVTISPDPASGYVAEVQAINTSNGTAIALTPVGNTYTFAVGSSDVDVTVTFVQAFDVTKNITGGTADGANKAKVNEPYIVTITPSSGYHTPATSIAVQIGGNAAVEGIDYTVSLNANVYTLTVLNGHVTGAIVITAVFPANA